MLRLISRVACRKYGFGLSSGIFCLSNRFVHNRITEQTKPQSSSALQPFAYSQSGKAFSVGDTSLTDLEYDEAMKNLNAIGLEKILSSALDQWGRLDSHGKPCIRPEIKDQWRKRVTLEFVNRLCDETFVEQTSKSSELLSVEIDKILVTSAISLAETEDECITILCPGAPHIGVEHDEHGVKYTLKHRTFIKNDQGQHCLRLIWESSDDNRNLYESQAELSSQNMMWHGTLEELFKMAELASEPSNTPQGS